MFGGMNFLPNAFSDFRDDVNMLIRRDWQKDDLQDQREDAERTWYRNYEAQKEFAKMGIQWKVEDATAAGLHPLYAIGGAGSAFSPTAIVGAAGGVPDAGSGKSFADMGQNLSRAAEATMTPEQRAEHDARMRLLEAQIAERDSQAELNWSQAFKNYGYQTDQLPPAMPSVGATDILSPRNVSQVKVKPDEVVSPRAGDAAVTGGTHSSLREYWITPSLKMRLPYSEEGPSEALENIPFWAWPAMIQHNRSYYGPDWGTRFIHEFVLGNSPKYRSSDPALRGSSMAAPKKHWFRGRSSGR